MELNAYLVKFLEIGRALEELKMFPAASKLSPTEFRLIREIIVEKERGRSIISSELARRLGITRSAVSQLVSKLEERDIVKRVASPTDRKIAYVQLSDRTLALFEEQCVGANESTERVIAKYGEARLNAFLEEYNALVQSFRETRKEMGK